MDMLYANLEDYDDVNALVELRQENENLKKKLEEYATNMENLQKHILQDFDHVTVEFKRLETNYSSLLKTARAEIERKTQTIVNLNLEKDTLVLKLKQNGNRFTFNQGNKKPFVKNNLQNKYNSDSESCKNDSKNSQDNQRLKEKTQDCSNERKELCQSPSEDAVSSNADSTSKLLKQATPGLGPSRNSELKENIALNNHDVKYNGASSIKNRRKSMPATRMPDPKFSSDEEDHYNLPKDDLKYDYCARKAPDRQNFTRDHFDRYTNKPPEVSNIEERSYATHDPLRDIYRSRNTRNYNEDKYHTRDRYNLRNSRRGHSPDRFRKQQRDYHENYYRSDYSRQRRLQTPPPDKPFEPHWIHRSRERNSHKEFNTNNYSNDKDRHTYNQVDRSASKRGEYDFREEPSAKRPRFGSGGSQHEEKSQWSHGRETLPMQEVCDILQEDSYSTCQSPDFMHPDLVPEHIHVIKEIKSFAMQKLDDPRVTNKKYVIHTANGKSTLSIVGGRNVDIIPIDKSLWDISSTFYMPAPLLQPPESNEENIIKQVYAEVHNTLSNISLESGEIDSVKDNEITIRESPYIRTETKDKPAVTNKDTETKSKEDSINVTSKRYRIPKLKTCDSVQRRDTETVVPSKDIPPKDSRKTSEERSISLELPKHCRKRKKSETSSDFIPSSDLFKGVNVIEERNCSEDDNKKSVLSSREIVEVDLELSDENSENTLLSQSAGNETVIEQAPFASKSNNGKVVEDRNRHNKSTHDEIIPVTSMKLNDDYNKAEKKSTNSKVEPESAVKDTLCTKKKVKDKKKPYKVKDSTQDTAVARVIDKRKPRKEKDKPKEIKNKFCELFGDSSSLITPEDLGVQPAQDEDEVPATNTCIPFLEDAQDAIDICTIAKPLNPQDIIVNNITLKQTIEKDDTKAKKIKRIKKSDEKPRPIDKVSNGELPTLPIVVPTKETDVVKTIIISSGVQQCADVIKPAERLPVENNSHVINTQSNVVIKDPDLLLKALATSTPHKPYVISAVEPLSATVASSDFSDSNTIDSQTDGDAPDVRIFVRRRRKAIKRT